MQATCDGQTGCLNHSAFVERLQVERANDTFGHVSADELLTLLGTALRTCVRSQDVDGRVGGDEFAVLAPDADENQTTDLAQRVQAELLTAGAHKVVGASVGTAVLLAGDDARELQQRADLALYVAKRGRHARREAITLD